MVASLSPPVNETPLVAGGGQHTQAWIAHFQQVSDALGQVGVATTTNDNAAAGMVGEFKSAALAQSSPAALTSFTSHDIASLALTAGDWDVWGSVVFAPAGSTTLNTIAAWISAASATIPGDLGTGGYMSIRCAFSTGQTQAIPAGRIRISAAATITIYLSALAGFGVSSLGAFGVISARRAR